MGASESIHNDSNNPVEVWFQLNGGKCPTGGCMHSYLQPGATSDNKYVSLSLANQVCVKYDEVPGLQSTAQTVCKAVTSPHFAGEHATYNVAEILDKDFPTPNATPIGAVDTSIHQLNDHASIDYTIFIGPLMCAAALIALVKQICKGKSTKSATVTFSISYDTRVGEEVRVVGNTAALGDWDPSRAAPMKWTDRNRTNLWSKTVDLEFPPGDEPLQYKYLVTSSEGDVKHWEPCDNHVLHQKQGYAHICRDGWGKCDTWSSEHGPAIEGA
eukprot:gnl/MRDRNA2_/MRDRNA2_104888_c0_seq1.p1 gnl/MRDRNA2_/MRDRNA2_104888_c0~~gnl/MRDRNA2_/MRDRNA2_104888_c0_seq1.p1  ORF type:complete len:271 (+),score=42.29 gnl/MRDRNA2_/MRDRNA2_104888_c0_seq1:82-894(+)